MDKIVRLNYRLDVMSWELVKVSPYSDKEISVQFIIAVSEYTDIPVLKIKSRSRKREILRARQLCIYIIRKYTGMSLKSIGEQFGDRDHTTVIHSLNTIKDLMDTKDPYVYDFFTQFDYDIGRFFTVRNKNILSNN
jgi:chromosomal replication initiator protein